MPQMAPLNWLMLFIFFTMIFIMFNFINYYMFMYTPKMSKMNNYMKKTINWKW
uniref:ATP synthase complex subunit 8 n=1 Tax=Astenus lyonessius TaxID=347273 RepID=A0A0S2M6T0_9COLE|nr:ATP synthase F0 subunit 8 [Astenus lyonessius]